MGRRHLNTRREQRNVKDKSSDSAPKRLVSRQASDQLSPMPGIETPDPPAAWLALTATERGAAHVAAGLPNQDAAVAYPTACGAVAAVADGHGHRRHFRSDRGSRLAVAVAGEAAQELTGRLDGLAAAQIEAEAQG